MSDIVQRLLDPEKWALLPSGEYDVTIEAAQEIGRLRARIAALEAALRPFADVATAFADVHYPDSHVKVCGIAIGHLRAAAAALADAPGEGT